LEVEYLNSTIVIPTNTQGTLDTDHLVLEYAGGQHKAGYCLNGDKLSLFTPQGKAAVTVKTPSIDDFVANNEANAGGIKAPMNGSLIAVIVTTGQQVLAGEALMVVEAMKMEHTITAPNTGIVGEIYFKIGDLVDADSQLLELIDEDA
jgi:3-methylcrotonyl-CoA carboxylase alpha subunit